MPQERRKPASAKGHAKSAAKSVAPKRSMALAVSGLENPVELRRHPSARRLTLRIHQARRTVIVTVPVRCRVEEADRFVQSNIDWVRERLLDLPDTVALRDGARIPLRGVVHVIRFTGVRSRNRVVDARVDGGRPVLVVNGALEHAPRRLRDWLYAEAKSDLDCAVLRHAERLKLRARGLSVRDQGGRWGSCSSTGALSFSWRLVLAPPFVLDYVAAHEVAHLKEMNHGPRFWALVKLTLPDMDAARTWLSVHGLELHRYAPRGR